MSDLAPNCLRCGVSLASVADVTDPVGLLCWPPGREQYFVRHLFSRAHEERRKKRDEEKLARWKENAHP